mgnify:CR=1 FL=1
MKVQPDTPGVDDPGQGRRIGIDHVGAVHLIQIEHGGGIHAEIDGRDAWCSPAPRRPSPPVQARRMHK